MRGLERSHDGSRGGSCPCMGGVLGMSFTGLLSALVWAQGRSRATRPGSQWAQEANDRRLAAVTQERGSGSRAISMTAPFKASMRWDSNLQRVRNVVDRDPVEARARIWTRAPATLNEVVSEPGTHRAWDSGNPEHRTWKAFVRWCSGSKETPRPKSCWTSKGGRRTGGATAGRGGAPDCP